MLPTSYTSFRPRLAATFHPIINASSGHGSASNVKAPANNESLASSSQTGTHVKEISNTNFLVSVQYDHYNSANLEVFDISEKGNAKKIYSLGEVSGCKSYITFCIFHHLCALV